MYSKKPNAPMFLYSCYTLIKHLIILKGFNSIDVYVTAFHINETRK